MKLALDLLSLEDPLGKRPASSTPLIGIARPESAPRGPANP